MKKIQNTIKLKVSPFKPRFIKNLIPSGLNFFSFHAGFKKTKNDLIILIFEKPVNVQCVYSLTSTPSAPIIWDKENNKGKCKALIVNSGNANAHTGINGIKIINKYVLELTKKIKCKKNEILVSSTGVIGEIFDPSIIINSINKIKEIEYFACKVGVRLEKFDKRLKPSTYFNESTSKLGLGGELIYIVANYYDKRITKRTLKEVFKNYNRIKKRIRRIDDMLGR